MNLHQTGLVMRLSILFLTVGFLNASAGGFSQTITLRVQNAPLEKVFHEIEKQSGYSFLYEKGLLQKARPVNLEVTRATVDQVLGLCFANQSLVYSIIEKVVVVKEKEERKTETYSVVAAPPVGEVKGRITNVGGEPLANANVIIKRSGYGTQSDVNGVFVMKNTSPDDILIISYTGYKAQTVKINGRSNFTLVMEVATNELDEAVVQAYGKITRRINTGNIEKVTAAEIERQPIMNPMLALQGKVAGLDVKQTSGYASAPIKIELRGRPNINSNFTSDPLYIVDGVPLTVIDISGNSNYSSGSPGFLQSGFPGPANGQSPFFSLNPADIESIEVLKDADATAIYGSRGANGVILISTKKGKAGKTKFDIHVQEGVTKVVRFYDLMNTQQYLSMRREALANDGIKPTLAHGDYDLTQWDTTKYTDWQRVLYGGIGRTIDAQAGLSGGNTQTNFRLGAGYNHTTNILTVSGADQRGSLSFNLTNHSIDQRFSVSLLSGYSFTQSDMISISASAITLPPDAPPVYDSAGNLNFNAWGGKNSPSRNSYRFNNLKQPYTSKTNFLNSNLVLSYQPVKSLRISSSFGYNHVVANSTSYQLIASQDPLNNPTGTANLGSTSNSNWIIEPQIAYDNIIGRGKINFLLGSSLQQTNTDGSSIVASGYTSDILIKSISSAPIWSAGDFHGEYKYAAIFGRLTYAYSDKYIISLTARRDGSSRFGEGKQYGNFGSVGAAWIFSEEHGFKEFFPFISFGKIRGSYGLTGSDAVGDYAYLTRWSSDGTQPYNGATALMPTQHANPDFHWSTTRKLEGAIDFTFFNDRVTIEAVYYRNRCGNQLVSFPTPAFSGFTSVVANSPALVQNDGWEFTASAKIINNRKFRWEVNFNGAFNHNKLVSYPNFALSPYVSTLVVGQPLNIIRIVHLSGVDPQTGQYTFEDKNHDGLISRSTSGTPTDDYVKSLAPQFFGGIGMNFVYKGIQLSLFFNVKEQTGRNAFVQTAGSAGKLGNQPAEIIGHEWQKPGDVAQYAKFTTQSPISNSLFQSSDGKYTDASFIRLSNLSLAYSFAPVLVNKLGVKGCNLFFHSNNLFLITKYKGTDPEIQNFGGMPSTKNIVGGISFNF